MKQKLKCMFSVTIAWVSKACTVIIFAHPQNKDETKNLKLVH